MSRVVNDPVPKSNEMTLDDDDLTPAEKAKKEKALAHLRKKHMKVGEFCENWSKTKSVAAFVTRAKSKYGVELKAGSVISRAARLRSAKKPIRLPYRADEQNQNDSDFLNDKYDW